MRHTEEPVTPKIDDSAEPGPLLKAELTKTRWATGKTQRDVADALGWPVAVVIRIERGNADVSRDDLLALLSYYRVTDQHKVDALIDTAEAARRESWVDFRDVLSPTFLTYLGFESSARQIQNYEPLLIPGLVQTEEYALAVQTEVLGEPADVAEGRWEARLRRQKLHADDTPPRMSFILDQAAIRRQTGGAGVMRNQLNRLREWTDEPHGSLQIIPFTAGGYPGIGFPFVVLELLNPTEPDVLYLEHATERTTRDSEEAGAYLARFFELEEIALTPGDSQALLDQAIRDLS